MRKYRLGVCVACALASATALPAAEEESEAPIPFHGPAVHPGYPDAFHVGYVLERSALSPDKRYGVIYPSRFLADNPGADFVVDVPASRVLALLQIEEPYFSGKGHGSIDCRWAPDSSAVLVENGGKWMPRNLLLIELKDGAVTRQTDLLEPLARAFAPAIAKADHVPVAHASVGEMSITSVRWKTGRSLQLEIRCDGGTNPKGFPEQSAWAGNVTAVWDLAQHKFVQQKVTQTSFTKGGAEE